MPNFNFCEKDVELDHRRSRQSRQDPVPLEMRDKTTQAIAEGRSSRGKELQGLPHHRRNGGDIRQTKEQALWPPNLKTEGAKTQPLWLHAFLEDPEWLNCAPWLTARMPTFHLTEQQAATIERYFSAVTKSTIRSSRPISPPTTRN